MSQEITNKIANIKAKMKHLDPASILYQSYSDVVRELEANLPKPKLHVDAGSVCESCE